MSKDEILSILEEIPLYVTFRVLRCDNGSPVPPIVKRDNKIQNDKTDQNEVDFKVIKNI